MFCTNCGEEMRDTRQVLRRMWRSRGPPASEEADGVRGPGRATGAAASDPCSGASTSATATGSVAPGTAAGPAGGRGDCFRAWHDAHRAAPGDRTGGGAEGRTPSRRDTDVCLMRTGESGGEPLLRRLWPRLASRSQRDRYQRRLRRLAGWMTRSRLRGPSQRRWHRLRKPQPRRLRRPLLPPLRMTISSTTTTTKWRTAAIARCSSCCWLCSWRRLESCLT